MGKTGHRLPDQLRTNLRLVFVGTAAGRRSAELGQYYAKPGNRFWRALREAGITPREYRPNEFAKLLALGIGFTDMSKRGAGMDREIAGRQFDVPGFEAKMRRYRPQAVAFTSKRAAAVWLGARSTAAISYGRRETGRADFPDVFVLPSPSGAAGRYWDLAPWSGLGDWLKSGGRL